MDYQGAWDLARRGLAIDTYDPASTTTTASPSVRLGRTVDALDGFEVAASSPAFRTAAWTELAKIYAGGGRLRPARRSTRRAASTPMPTNLEARQLLRRPRALGDDAPAGAVARGGVTISTRSSHFARFERYLDPTRRAAAGGRSSTASATRCRTRRSSNWPPGITTSAGWTTRGSVLEVAPPQDEVLYWLAFLQDALHDPAAGRDAAPGGRGVCRASCSRSGPRAPRCSSGRWAGRRTGARSYYLALILWSRGDTDARARPARARAATRPTSRRSTPPARRRSRRRRRATARWPTSAAPRSSSPREWRYGRLLAERFIEDRAFDQALDDGRALRGGVAGQLHPRHAARQDAAARRGDSRRGERRAGRRLNVLPYEGATEARGALPRGAADVGGRADARPDASTRPRSGSPRPASGRSASASANRTRPMSTNGSRTTLPRSASPGRAGRPSRTRGSRSWR